MDEVIGTAAQTIVQTSGQAGVRLTSGIAPVAGSGAGSGRRRWPGRVALVLGILTPLAVVVALQLTGSGTYSAATLAAWIAIGVSVLALATGIVAIVARWGRPEGIAGVVLGVVGNPLVLLYGLGSLSVL